MLTPPTPADEPTRLEALRRTCLLDTPSEERFDRLTRLACGHFGVPMALISLIDSDRQWFKSRQGLTQKETPRSISFCGHAILDADLKIHHWNPWLEMRTGISRDHARDQRSEPVELQHHVGRPGPRG